MLNRMSVSTRVETILNIPPFNCRLNRILPVPAGAKAKSSYIQLTTGVYGRMPVWTSSTTAALRATEEAGA
jgi:hypothetical protein